MTGPISLEDRSEITDLLSAYALLMDQGRIDEWLELFHPEAQMRVPGMADIRSHADRRRMAAEAPVGTHICAPPLIKASDRSDEVTVEQAYIFRSAGEGPVLSGWYEDRLEKRDGVWRILTRNVYFARRAPRQV